MYFNNLAAAVGLAQLEQLDQWIDKRREVNTIYRELLGRIPGIVFQDEPEGVTSNYWLTTILIDDKVTGFTNDNLRVALMKNGIETRFLWKPLHMQPVFRKVQFFGGDISKSLFQKGICLPSSADLTYEDQENIVGIVIKELAKTF